ncbi:MAG TPA: class I SAM-dependent methyltransferase [Candidatus Eisenbacteria bacterium]|nr:class I SAM-dependent methyltransferase [Candidatus Eisenbacteria bacterium]
MIRPCPVCGASGAGQRVHSEAKIDPSRVSEFTYASRKNPEFMHHRLVLCGVCDLLYADPAPDPDSTRRAYEAAAYDSSEEAHCAARTYAETLDGFLSRLPAREGALDVGTGDGAFLEELLARGFTRVAGIEPSEAPARAARADVRPLIRKRLDAESLDGESLALVTCFQTMEHLHEPAALCRVAYRLLKPGGALFLVCHDRRSAVNRLLGKKSPIFDIEHLQLFSPRSAAALMTRSGFPNATIRPIRNRYPLRYWIRLLPLGLQIKNALLALAEKLKWAGRPVALNVGNMAVIGFKGAAA